MKKEGSFRQEGYLRENYHYFHLCDTAGQERDYHFHEFDKLVILLSGHVDYGVEGDIYNLRPWDVLLVGHHTIHKALIDRAEPYERVIIYLDGQYVEQIMGNRSLLSCFEQAERQGRYLLRPGIREKDELSSMLAAYEQASSDDRFGSKTMCDTIFMQMLICVNRIFEENGGSIGSQDKGLDPKIAQIMSYMTEHLNEPITVEEIAARAYLSKYHFMRLFKIQTGTTVHSWLRQKRLLYAAHAIRSGVPAVKAAADSGFGEYSTFYRAFKETFGVTPGKLK